MSQIIEATIEDLVIDAEITSNVIEATIEGGSGSRPEIVTDGTAGAPIVTGQPLRRHNGKFYPASPQYPTVAGFALNNANTDGWLAVILEGNISMLDWTGVAPGVNLQESAPYFVNGNGQISVAAPTSGYIHRVGLALNQNQLNVRIEQPIKVG